jgi:hypothetical protein
MLTFASTPLKRAGLLEETVQQVLKWRVTFPVEDWNTLLQETIWVRTQSGQEAEEHPLTRSILIQRLSCCNFVSNG